MNTRSHQTSASAHEKYASQTEGRLTDKASQHQMSEDWMKIAYGTSDSPSFLIETTRLIREIGLHQTELEAQNEELRMARNAAQEAADKFAELYDFAPAGYFTLAKNGKIAELNLCASQMLGKDRARLVNSRLSTFVSVATRLVFKRFLARLFKSGAKESCEIILLANGNSTKYIHLTGCVAWNGELCLLIAVDISEDKKAEQTLLLSEEKYRILFYNNPQPMFIFDQESLAFLEVNQAAVSQYGYSKNEFKKMTFKDLHPAGEIPLLINETEQTRVGFNPNGEWRHIKKDGTPIFVEIASQFVNCTGRRASHVLVHNITSRKEAEAEIKLKNEELQRINAEKDKFYSIIAHDLRSPFNGFLGLTELMDEGLAEMTPEEIRQSVSAMRNSATNLFRLLGNLLEWSRLQRGLSEFFPSLYVLQTKMSDSINVFLEAANKKEISISVNIADDLMVFADGNMLDGVIRNIISNAVKFTPQRGKIAISAKPSPPDWVEIAIRDTGIGISRQMTDDLFRLDVNTNRKGTDGEYSSGLGLILCKDFVEKHGGKLSVESEEGKGSTFLFTMPAKK